MASENFKGYVPSDETPDEGRTLLVDLDEVGFALDEEHLPLVVGGMRPQSSLCTIGGCEDCD